MDVADWLRRLGFGQYEAAFRDNGIGEAVLHHLTIEDLKEIGVTTVGDRRMLLAAIAALSSPTSSDTAGPQPSPAPTAKAPELSAERRPVTVRSAISSARRASPRSWTQRIGVISSTPISTRLQRR